MLTSALPIVEMMLHLVCEEDAWFLRVAHRHQGGIFGDCSADNYPRLTLDEAQDVIDATTCELAAGGGGDDDDELDEEPF